MQWEMVEGIVAWFKHKRWPLPLFVVVILIVLSFMWGAYDPSEVVKERSIHPVVITESPVTDPSPTPSPTFKVVHNPPQKAKSHMESKPDKNTFIRKQDEEDSQDRHIEQGNISHFKDSLTDALKVEGLDPSVSDKIFKHMRAQLDETNTGGYEIADSVRAVMPDASDEEVYRITDLISNTATESSNHVGSQ